MFDIFYSGKKPNLFAHEQQADTIEDAQKLSRTRFFWWTNYLSDYSTVDFLWEPLPWESHQRHAWQSQHQPDSGTYLVPKDGYVETNYRTTQQITRLVSQDNWTIPDNVDIKSFDVSWHPNPLDPPYIYHFPSQHQSSSGVIYTVPGATEVKLVDAFVVKALPSNLHWVVLEPVADVDFSWHPNPLDPPYIYQFGNQWNPAEYKASVQYVVPGATEIKYMERRTVRSPNYGDQWRIDINVEAFDYSWEPNPFDPPYIYVFGNQWNPGVLEPTIRYIVEGATETKYVNDIIATVAQDSKPWEVLDDIVGFDYSWRPNPTDPPYIYVFGNQWLSPEQRPALRYVVPEATEIKYMDLPKANRSPHPELFTIHYAAKFDYTWEPDPGSPPYIYVFGNQHWPAEIMPTVEYVVEGATERKFVDEPVAMLPATNDCWKILVTHNFDFDYSWCPDPGDPPFIYVFGNQWHSPEIMPTVEYCVPDAIERKFVPDIVATLHADNTMWSVPEEVTAENIDFSWVPDPGEPPYIYHFGSDFQMSIGLTYTVPTATELKFAGDPPLLVKEKKAIAVLDIFYIDHSNDASAARFAALKERYPHIQKVRYVSNLLDTINRCANKSPTNKFWVVSSKNVYDDFDFSWHAQPWQNYMTHVFGSQWSRWSNTFLINKYEFERHYKWAKDIIEFPNLHFISEQKSIAQADTSDIFYIDHSNAASATRFAKLQKRYPHIQKVRYVNNILDTVARCLSKSLNKDMWVISSKNVYDDFDFSWHAHPNQVKMTHVFGSQWNKWSDTFLINKYEFERHYKWAKGIEEFPDLDFSTAQQVSAPADASDIYVIDFGNVESKATIDYLSSKYRVVKTARYFDNYLDTLRRILDTVDNEQEHIWVVGSVCDYTQFDFSWQPEAWQRDMLQVFPSKEQKFGDTFYVPVIALKEKIKEIELLDWFETVNYCNDQQVERWPVPVIQHDEDSHVDAAIASDFSAPLAVFTNREIDVRKIPTVSLWREKTKTIVPLDAGAGSVIVPKNAIARIQTQMYDYPHIDRTKRNTFTDQPLDIVFISNGESNAEQNWEHLQKVTKGIANRVVRVDGVNGRVAAYRAALNASNTPWAFCVFAKLEVDAGFDWTWLPDRMQQAKHYIFHAKNPVNGLEYGHMAMIAYNKQLTLTNAAEGLDFTLDQAHEVVPMLSGVARYADDPWMAWRSAFRECIKLQHSLPDVENEYRLNQWCEKGDGELGKWSKIGANDAVDYYESVGGDFAELRKSYEWEWLATYLRKKHNR